VVVFYSFARKNLPISVKTAFCGFQLALKTSVFGLTLALFGGKLELGERGARRCLALRASPNFNDPFV
jgi:hypothetical protein